MNDSSCSRTTETVESTTETVKRPYLSGGLRPWHLFPLAATFACAKPVQVQNIEAQLGAGLLVAAPIARMLASQLDQEDGAVGCIVGETLGASFEAAGRQMTTGRPDPESTLDLCECLAMRDDWATLDISSSIAANTTDAIQAVSVLVQPYIQDCQARAWFESSTAAVAMLIGPISEALTLERCEIPIPPIVPNLEVCDV